MVALDQDESGRLDSVEGGRMAGSSGDWDSSPDDRSAGHVRALAVIVAYNSEAALARNLHNLDAQTRPVDGVLIVDNSQPDAADVSGISFAIMARTNVLRSGSNLGPAGGFALGLATFLESGSFTHAWLMDDDCYPEPRALELLLHQSERMRKGSVVFPAAVYEATGVAMNYLGWSGVLIDRLAVQMAGLPMAELFWWAEDTEYLQYRLPRKGVVTARVDESRILYDLVRRSPDKPAWKYYYEVRNDVWFRTRLEGWAHPGRLGRTLVRQFGSALFRHGSAEKVRMYGRGLVDGLMGRLGVTVIPPVSPEQSAAARHDD